jgi:hypothetical protein
MLSRLTELYFICINAALVIPCGSLLPVTGDCVTLVVRVDGTAEPIATAAGGVCPLLADEEEAVFDGEVVVAVVVEVVLVTLILIG